MDRVVADRACHVVGPNHNLWFGSHDYDPKVLAVDALPFEDTWAIPEDSACRPEGICAIWNSGKDSEEQKSACPAEDTPTQS